jgi:PAS domain S-box-containing protein
MDCFNLIAPQSHETVRQYIDTEEEGPYEVFNMKTDGTVFEVQVRARKCQWDGKTVRIATFRDLTEQKKLKQQLKDSERMYRELYYNAKAALYRTRTHDGKLLACSTALAKMHGYESVEECIQKHHGTDHYVDKNRRKQLLEQLGKNKRVEDFEYLINRADGKRAWLSLSAEIFPEKGWIEGVITDITASKLLTPTEMKILKILLTGKSNKEIAYRLDRSVRTIEDHRANIMRKLDVDNIVDLTRKALEYGIKPDGE